MNVLRLVQRWPSQIRSPAQALLMARQPSMIGTSLRVAERRCFSSEVTAPARVPLRARLRSFLLGFSVATALASYAIVVKVHWTAEELNSVVREAAGKQASIEKRLAALEKR
mmetsp:Transcript_68773/g.165058  ORF Transcript_68773/g.165058 Transcript_68773/m.165058 type:complete len:112 (+) Transcript_68773:62-397(+)